MRAQDAVAPLLGAGVLLGLGLGPPGDILGLSMALALAIAAAALVLMLAGMRGFAAGAYAVFALRIGVAFGLLTGGLLLLLFGSLMAQALGAAMLAGALGVALGFLAPWAGLYAALAFPLAVPLTGTWAWLGLALAALALALTDDDRLGVDALLGRRGGLFPVVRRDVVLAPAPAAARRRRGP